VKANVVLVVEDEPLIRMIAAEMLADAGWSVVEFATADEASVFCKQPENDIAAVFTDINLPGTMDGLGLAALVAASRPTAAIVVTSGRYREPPAHLTNRVRFVPKPWDAQSLLAAIQKNDSEPSLRRQAGQVRHQRARAGSHDAELKKSAVGVSGRNR
jgi:DNA-binding NtrC family response regulator